MGKFSLWKAGFPPSKTGEAQTEFVRCFGSSKSVIVKTEEACRALFRGPGYTDAPAASSNPCWAREAGSHHKVVL
jgi:hypothetical protein